MKPPLLTSGVVVWRRGADGPRFLLLRAYRNWGFPKGVVEAGETPLAAAIREVAEETGVDDLRFPPGEPFVETPPYAGNKVARFHVAETTQTAVDLGRNPSGFREHHEYRWTAYAEARPLLVPRLQAVLDWAAEKIAKDAR